MMTYDFSSQGFPRIFSEMVARACMVLPPLTQEDDGTFVLGMAGKVINAFWSEYVGALPYEIQSELLLAINAGNQEGVLGWFALYADFQNEENARTLAGVILDELNEDLPELIKEEYSGFHEVSPVSA